jgi:HK97 family phage prohead protease
VFAAEMSPGEGRTVDVRVVPYGERATVADGLGGVPAGVPYQEEWVLGAFSHQLGAANRVLANFEHQSGLAGVIGHGLALREASDGLHGSFKLHETPDGDKALTLVREGVLGGVSLEAVSRKAVRTASGVVRRVKADLRAVALCRDPAFKGAVVLALRESEFMLDEELLPVELDPELVARCRRLGIRIPQRLEAHPAMTGTPAAAGTPDGGTRPPDTTSTEVPAL